MFCIYDGQGKLFRTLTSEYISYCNAGIYFIICRLYISGFPLSWHLYEYQTVMCCAEGLMLPIDSMIHMLCVKIHKERDTDKLILAHEDQWI